MTCLERVLGLGAGYCPDAWKKHTALGLACHARAVMDSVLRFVHTGPERGFPCFQLPAKPCWVPCGYHEKKKRGIEKF